MAVVSIDTDDLVLLIKEAISETIKAERMKLIEAIIPKVSELEMEDIIDLYGNKPEPKEYVDMTSWLENEN